VKAEIISIGDEMTNGQRLDTNSRWLSQQLADLGVTTLRHTTVADDLEANIELFKSAAQRADVVISTGGLGPTLDDLTREALACAFDAPLELDIASLKHIEEMFAQRKRPMPERNRVQAMMPRGSRVITNPHGTAPGIDLTIPRSGQAASRIFALPGVPAEMVEMWRDGVRNHVIEMLGSNRQQLMFHTIKLFGIGESDVEVQLPDLMRRDRNPRVGITVSRATISLRIAAPASSITEFAALIAPTIAEIEAALGVLIFGTGEDELEHAVLRQLHALNLKLAVLEIGPGAFVGNWLLSAAGEDQTHLLSVLSCPSQANAVGYFKKLGILPDVGMGLAPFAELAACMRSAFDADIGLAFGTYASTQQLEQRKPAADVNVAIAGAGLPQDVKTRTIIGHPDILNDRVAKTALDTLRLALIKAGAPR
jgi:nicotinamide-nucleotide amidase